MGDPLQPSAAPSAAIFHADAGVEDDADSVARHGGKEPFQAVRAMPGMEGGAGEFSYTRNSSMQSRAVDILKPILKQKIGELNLDDWEAGSTVRMADFGCSVGANALQYAEICFQSVQDCCQVRASKPPAVQYFFCDLPSNDFNTLFRQLEEWRSSRRQGAEWKNFYPAAVPGSFHKRLFPSRSLHVAISVLALHWMSQVPDAVLDRDSPAYNKGRVWIDRNKNAATVEAYGQAARQDLRKYLLARAEEVVAGGVVLLYFLGRADGSHPELQWPDEARFGGPSIEILEETWEELVAEGIIDEERRDSFNIPFYCPSVDEVRAVAESTNAYDIKRLEIERHNYFSPHDVEQVRAAPEQYGEFVANALRAAMNSFTVEHIGEKSAAELFHRLERNAAAAGREGRVTGYFLDRVLAVLVRK